MKIRTIKYYISESIKNIFKNGIMSVASIMIVASSIFILALAYCIVVNISFGLYQIERDVQILVFIEQDATDEDVDILHDRLLDIENILSIEYVSAEEALENFSLSLGDQQGILAGLRDSNPLPRKFILVSEKVEYQQDIVEAINALNRQLRTIETVRNSQGVVDALMNINRVVGVISVVIVVGLSIFSTIIIMNTIRLAVNNRKNEIEIMKYVGATDWFVKWPFVIEGVFIGVVGAAIPVAICFLMYNSVQNTLYLNVPLIENIVFQDRSTVFLALLPLAVCLGMAIGFVGSYLSVRQYLKV